MRFLKGQAEFVAIAAIILIALIVVVISFQQGAVTPPVVSGIEQEAKTVKDSVNGIIRTGVREQMDLIYRQGGTLTPETGLNVEFGMFKTAVWQACDQTNVPDVAKWMEAGIGAYLRNNLKREEEFAGKKVTFDLTKMDVDVDVFRDNMRVRVNLPSTIVGYSIPQPYEVSLPTKLYDILEFGGNFVNENAEGRLFENRLLLCMQKSPTDPQSKDWLRTFDVITGCGNIVSKKRSDLLPAMRKYISLTISQVLWFEEPPIFMDRNCFFSVDIIGGKVYPDLYVHSEYPSSWDSELDQNFFFSPNPVNFIGMPIGSSFIPVCITPYEVFYTVRYPVIIMVEDSLTNQMFHFAVMAEMVNNQPGDCTSFELDTGETDYTETCIDNAKCSAKITVKDVDGNLVEGADVTFDICDLGMTDSSGVFEGPIPCSGLAELHVYKSGYKSYGTFIGADQLKDFTVELMERQEEITIHFNGVPLKCHNPDGLGTGEVECESYIVEGQPKPILNFGQLKAILPFSPKDASLLDDCADDGPLLTNDVDGSLVNTMSTEAFCPGDFDASGFVIKNFGMTFGYMNSSFTLKGTDKDIYINMPVVLKVDGDEIEEGDLEEPIKEDETEQLMDVLKNCGIQPVSTSIQSADCV